MYIYDICIYIYIYHWLYSPVWAPAFLRSQCISSARQIIFTCRNQLPLSSMTDIVLFPNISTILPRKMEMLVIEFEMAGDLSAIVFRVILLKFTIVRFEEMNGILKTRFPKLDSTIR